MNELAELQSVDFALGAFIAAAFAGYAPGKGPQGWQEFIRRPVNRQIFRHDADTPEQFMRDFLSSQKDKKDVPGQANTTLNAPLFPVVYYFRKPGFVNTQDQRGARGRVWHNGKPFDLKLRPVALDYSLVFLAWDKLTLDKLCLAWYTHIYDHDSFHYPCVIGDESFDIRAALPDNKNVVIQNGSDTVDGKRLYAASATPLSLVTNILMGREIEPPGPVRIIFGGVREQERRYILTPEGDGTYVFDTSTREKSVPFRPCGVEIMVGARVVARDNGAGVFDSTYMQDFQPVTVTGTVNYFTGTLHIAFSTPANGPVSVIYTPLQGRITYWYADMGADAVYTDVGGSGNQCRLGLRRSAPADDGSAVWLPEFLESDIEGPPAMAVYTDVGGSGRRCRIAVRFTGLADDGSRVWAFEFPETDLEGPEGTAVYTDVGGTGAKCRLAMRYLGQADDGSAIWSPEFLAVPE